MPIQHLPVPDPESAKRMIEIATKVYSLRDERARLVDRVEQIDEAEPALIDEYLALQAAQTLSLTGKAIELVEPKPPEPVEEAAEAAAEHAESVGETEAAPAPAADAEAVAEATAEPAGDTPAPEAAAPTP